MSSPLPNLVVQFIIGKEIIYNASIPMAGTTLAALVFSKTILDSFREHETEECEVEFDGYATPAQKKEFLNLQHCVEAFYDVNAGFSEEELQRILKCADVPLLY